MTTMTTIYPFREDEPPLNYAPLYRLIRRYVNRKIAREEFCYEWGREQREQKTRNNPA